MLVSKIRQRLRLTTTVLDAEIADLISECKSDLLLSGVAEGKILDDDPLILRAVSTYCRAYYEKDNAAATRLQAAYDMLKGHLTLSTDYGGQVEVP